MRLNLSSVCRSLVCVIACLFGCIAGSAQSFTSHGLTLHYTVLGHGTPILVLPGGPGMDVSYMLPAAELLAPAHTVILLAPRGTTGSMPAEVNAQTVNLALYLDDYEALRQHLGYNQWAVLGHSGGTYFALRYALAHPAAVSRLVLSATVTPTGAGMAHFDENIESRLSEAELKRAMDLDGKTVTDALMAEEAKLTFSNAYFFDRAVGRKFGETMTAENCHGQTSLLLMTEWGSYDLRPDLAKLHIPTLILEGRQDPLDLELASETRDAIPGARLVTLEKAGHFSWLEQPKIFAETITDFLAH